jgi:CxxC-x17-CxxC domain-containing protein
MNYTDTEIECQDCNNVFAFTAKEAQFYEEKQFAPPKRCRDCRDIRKQNKAGRDGGGQGNGGGQNRGGNSRGNDRGTRELFDAVCSDCGKDTQVPFKPSGDRPVYCRDCFKRGD